MIKLLLIVIVHLLMEYVLRKVFIQVTLLFNVHTILIPIVKESPNRGTKQLGKALCSKRLGWIYS